MKSLSDRLEILSISLLSENRELANEFRHLARRLEVSIGWHYLLDFIWTARKVSQSPALRILDAGAGMGLMQWWLAGRGKDVVSVDTEDRARMPFQFRRWSRVVGLRPEDLAPVPSPRLVDFLPSSRPWRWHRYPEKLVRGISLLKGNVDATSGHGTVTIYRQNLKLMPEINDGTVDMVVSISALEHNNPEDLRKCVSELLRVLRPGGILTATLPASKSKDLYHEPSRGWCYTETTLRDVFGIGPGASSNFDEYDELFEELKGSAELRDNLDPMYFASGENGMPWGIWDPKYQPVSVVKIKE